MALLHPLTLPEIRALLGEYLLTSDLTRCVQVSRAWHDSFMVLLWSSLTFEPFEQARKGAASSPSPFPRLDALRCHRHLVTNIRYFGVIPPEHVAAATAVHYPNLTSLEFRSDKNILEAISILLSLHSSTLARLEIWVDSAKLTSPFKNALLGLSRLQSLSLSDMTADNTDYRNLWRWFEQLDSLTLHRFEILDVGRGALEDETSIPAGTKVCSNLRQLSFSVPIQASSNKQIALLSRCPNLNSLTYSDRFKLFNDLTEELTKYFTAGTWPQLQTVSLQGVWLSDEQLSRIISSISQLRELHVPDGKFGALSSAALRPHYPWIREIRLRAVKRTSQSVALDIPEILASCPLLERFSADKVLGRSILEGQPWICTETLKELELYFHLESPTESPSAATQQHDNIYERLSELKNLEILNLSNTGGYQTETVKLSLSKGLDRLKTLRRLRCLYFEETGQILELVDAQWMINHWKRLDIVYGDFRHERGVSTCRALLRDAGICT